MQHVIAVDLGGTQLRAALVAADGQVVAHARTATLVAEGPDAVVRRMLALIAQVRTAVPADSPLLGIGIGAPGPLDPRSGTVFAPPNLPGWSAVPLRAMVADGTGLPVELGNDANAAALGEWRFGGGRGHEHLVYITVSTGIGGGVIEQGRLLIGHQGAGYELGFMILDAATGTNWEDLASGTALAAAAAAAMVRHPDTLLHRLARPADVSGAHVAAAAAQGDAVAAQLMEREAHYLGLGLASCLQLFSPELILVGGSVTLHNPQLLERARAVAYAHVKVDLYRRVPIEPAQLGEGAGILGAAALALSAFEAS